MIIICILIKMFFFPISNLFSRLKTEQNMFVFIDLLSIIIDKAFENEKRDNAFSVSVFQFVSVSLSISLFPCLFVTVLFSS